VEIFPPGKSFEAIRLPNGQILISELARKEPPTIRPRRINGKLRGAAVELTRADIAAAVRAERDER
jgi:hypothetical protein